MSRQEIPKNSGGTAKQLTTDIADDVWRQTADKGQPLGHPRDGTRLESGLTVYGNHWFNIAFQN